MKVTDPVCGKELDMSEVASFAEYEGWAYFFCSDECRKRFMAWPPRFADEPARANARAAGGETGM